MKKRTRIASANSPSKSAKQLGMRKDELNLLRMMGTLHDIGKIAVDERILNKTEPLSAEEWTEIRRHPEIGYRILSTTMEYAEIAGDILAHHEYWNGNGYPKGIKGEADSASLAHHRRRRRVRRDDFRPSLPRSAWKRTSR
ncbi:MAG: HD domain-containing protein [Bacillus subtilis]|nr:HD domain-containing protein [Bacillus subtilis]